MAESNTSNEPDYIGNLLRKKMSGTLLFVNLLYDQIEREINVENERFWRGENVEGLFFVLRCTM